MKMDDNDLEVLDCPETPRETPEPSEQASNIAVDLVAYITSTPYNFLLTLLSFTYLT